MFGRLEFSHKIILSFRDQSADWSWESVSPGGRPTRSFIRAGAAAGLLHSQFPLRPITNKTLEGKGSAETIGFCWHSFVTFCRYWQKVTRRRHEKKLLLGQLTSSPARRVTSPKRIPPNIICIFHRQVLTNLPDFSNMIEKTGKILEGTVWNCIRLWPEIFTASASPSD